VSFFGCGECGRENGEEGREVGTRVGWDARLTKMEERREKKIDPSHEGASTSSRTGIPGIYTL